MIAEKNGLVYFSDFENLNNFIILNTNLVEVINYEVIIVKVNLFYLKKRIKIIFALYLVSQ